MNINQDANRMSIKGINQRLAADAFKAHNPGVLRILH